MENTRSENTKKQDFLFVAGPRLGNRKQQLHILNDLYQQAYDKGIKNVINVGPVVDGYYRSFTHVNPRFINSLESQAKYAVDMYPLVDGITTYYIDPGYYLNRYLDEEFTINKMLDKKREDMKFLGSRKGFVEIDGLKIFLGHSYLGNALDTYYVLKRECESLIASEEEFDILLSNSQHKDAIMEYEDKIAISLPVLHSETDIEKCKNKKNSLGGTFVTVYSDNGNIEDIDYNPVLYSKNDVWDECGLDRNKVKQLIIR